eukprot:CAMPEP_0172500954 /NCGR_PEP_ID=MMETSP1066-20121228/144493_1 /TAXON_ID=671091 /ORGANISM="Coscinodiscus wailesii, Strain CCMP2513" /LENGTH=30 /DNA_ID= /DNA_START= /DNA_END= /DNA_ORIENTATION=
MAWDEGTTKDPLSSAPLSPFMRSIWIPSFS